MSSRRPFANETGSKRQGENSAETLPCCPRMPLLPSFSSLRCVLPSSSSSQPSCHTWQASKCQYRRETSRTAPSSFCKCSYCRWLRKSSLSASSPRSLLACAPINCNANQTYSSPVRHPMAVCGRRKPELRHRTVYIAGQPKPSPVLQCLG